jgi:uncharacterized protein YecT (DUF1311 family)
MKRDYIKEILSKKDRQKFLGGYSSDILVLEKSLEQQLKLLGEEGNDCHLELMKHFPIAMVAYMESLFREYIKELIDFGYPYSENAKDFNKSEIKFDFQIVTEIQSKTISVGDFISHFLPLSNLENINYTMTTLIGKDFLNNKDFLHSLKSVVDSWPDDENKIYEPILKNASAVYRDVKKKFELRHIYCHEYTGLDIVDPELIKISFYNTKLFLEATSCLIRHLIAPTAPKTQSAMNQMAFDEFNQAEAEMNKIYEQVLNGLRVRHKSKLEEAQNHWVEVREKQVDLLANQFEGGSIFPLIYYSEMKSLTNQRIDELKKIIEIYKQYAH